MLKTKTGRFKKPISTLLIIVMALSLFPLSVSAMDNGMRSEAPESLMSAMNGDGQDYEMTQPAETKNPADDMDEESSRRDPVKAPPGVSLNLTSNNLTVVENTNIDLLAGATLYIEPESESENYSLIITDVTANTPDFSWNGTDTTINSGLPGTEYTVSYAVQDGEGLQEPDLTAEATIRVIAASSVQYAENLTEDGAYLTNFKVTLASDGTGPWDADDRPGNDSNANNGIVRNFDTVTYDLEASFASYQPDTYYVNGRIWYEMTLPYTAKEAVFDTSIMKWMEDGWTITTDPDTGYQTLRCSRKLVPAQGAQAAIPGSNSVSAAIQVLAMKNGDALEPTFKAWMDHNDTAHNPCDEHGRQEVLTAATPPVAVSAALRMNVQIKQIADTALDVAEKEYDFSTGNDLAVNKDKGTVTGCMTGYGLTLQLYNANGHGMKGLELPEGPITVTLDLSNSFLPDGTTAVDSPAGYAPLLWSYGRNINNNTADDGRYTGGRGYASNATPYSQIYTGNPWCCVPNNGSWSAQQQQDGKITFTVEGYDIDYTQFPQNNAGNIETNFIYYGADVDPKTEFTQISIGCFSSAKIYVLQPTHNSETGKRITEAGEYGSGTFTTVVTVGDLTAISSTGQKPQGVGGGVTAPMDNTNQQNTTDDRQANTVYLTRPGIWSPIIRYTIYNHGYNLSAVDVNNTRDCVSNGKDVAAVGQRLGIQAGFNYNSYGRAENTINAVNTLVKFDARALEIQRDIFRQSAYCYGMGETFLYGTLPNGGNWASDSQMNNAREGDLVWYTSLSAVPKGHLCVAVLREMRGAAMTGNETQQSAYFHIDLQVRKDFSLTDQVYQTVIWTRLWTASDLAEQLAQNPNYQVPSVRDSVTFTGDYPTAFVNYGPVYNKSVYQNGVYHSGHNGNYKYGDSLYIVPYVTKVAKSVEQKLPSNEPKSAYDMDYDQRVADYILRPRLEMQQGVTRTMTTTVTITDTLPKGLTYIDGSAVMGGTYQQASEEGRQGTVAGGTPIDPVITVNANGTSVLTWTIEDVPVVHGDLPVIHYSCDIGNPGNPNDDVVNNQHLENTATIATAEDMREFNNTHGNIAYADITIVKNKQLALFKVPLQRFFDMGENVAWMAGYDNNGNNPASVLLMDTMPYDGDSRGSSFSGGYTMARFEINAAALGADPQSFTIYYTTNLDYRDATMGSIDADTVRTWDTISINPDGSVTWGDIVPVCWAAEGTIPVGKVLRVTMEVEQDHQQPGDTLCNAFSDSNNSVTARAKVISRYLAGLTWVDMNRDGIRQSGEEVLPGVTATLHKADDDTIVKNLKGENCTMQTGEDGRYRFDNLPAGDFYVKFTSSDGVKLSDWYPSTTKAEGASENNNSDYVPTLTDPGRVNYGVIENIHMPDKDEMSSSLYYILYLDGGFYKAEGSLTVSKQLAGNDTDRAKEFTFTITLSDTTINGEYSGVTFKNGVATITLKGGESKTIEGLPNGTGYEVEEADYSEDGYTTTQTGDTGTIDENTPLVAAFTNTRDTFGDIIVKKTVSGNAGNKTKSFSFTVTLSDQTISDTYGDMTFTNGVATFTLKDGESKKATGLPNGITYAVTEADYTSDGYVTTKTGDTGTIIGDGELTAEFTNTKNSTPPPDEPKIGDLTVKKTVTGDLADKNKEFAFTITFNVEGNYSYTGSKSGTIKSGDTVLLKHGESITVNGLPAGTTYAVTENGNDGYRVYASGDKGTILANATSTAAFTNARSSVPQTGDDSSLLLWLGLTGAAGIVLLLMAILGRKRKGKRSPAR